MIKELFQSVKSHFLKYASSLKVERQEILSSNCASRFFRVGKSTHMCHFFLIGKLFVIF